MTSFEVLKNIPSWQKVRCNTLFQFDMCINSLQNATCNYVFQINFFYTSCTDPRSMSLDGFVVSVVSSSWNRLSSSMLPSSNRFSSNSLLTSLNVATLLVSVSSAVHIYYLKVKSKLSNLNPIRTGVILDQSWTGGANLAPLLSQPWGIWEIGAKNDFCDDFSEDYFEVHNISVAQNLTILEAILRFCWKCRKIRPRF